jgi:hypothetical protein
MGRYELRSRKTTNIWGDLYTTHYDVIDTQNDNAIVATYSTKGRKQKEAKSKALNKITELSALSSQGIGQNPDGTFPSIDGSSYSSAEEAQAANREFERREGLEENVVKFEDRITEAGRLREDLAQNVSARRQGQLLSNLRRSILGAGGDQAQIEALVPQITEQSERSLQDLITDSRARTQQQLAQFVPTEIGAEYNQAALSDTMSKFLMDESTQRAQIQADLDSQPEWWENILGQGAQLAGSLAVDYLTSRGGSGSGSGGMGSGGGY